MKKSLSVFLQVAIVIIAVAALAILVRLPLAEGRAANLDLFSIYSDPFIIYGYATSIAFFVALYQAFKLFGYIGQNKVFSPIAIQTLRNIKYCAITLGILIVAAALYIKMSHNMDDDPAGFIALSIAATFIVAVVAAAVAVFERILRSAVNIKSENDLLV